MSQKGWQKQNPHDFFLAQHQTKYGYQYLRFNSLRFKWFFVFWFSRFSWTCKECDAGLNVRFCLFAFRDLFVNNVNLINFEVCIYIRLSHTIWLEEKIYHNSNKKNNFTYFSLILLLQKACFPNSLGNKMSQPKKANKHLEEVCDDKCSLSVCANWQVDDNIRKPLKTCISLMVLTSYWICHRLKITLKSTPKKLGAFIKHVPKVGLKWWCGDADWTCENFIA